MKIEYRTETCPAINVDDLLSKLGKEGWEAWHKDSTESTRSDTPITVKIYFKRVV